MAKTYGQVLLELGRENENIFALSSDTWGLVAAFAREFPERTVEVGIAEQNLIGVAVGLAIRGKVPFAHGMAPFVTMRCFEQIRTDAAYGQRNVKIISVAGGISMGAWGVTHHAIEDMALMRVIPSMTVIMPADAYETELAVRWAARHVGAVYIYLGGGSLLLPDSERSFEVGKAAVLREGSDVTVIAAGSMVSEALRAGDLLSQRGISVHVLNMHTIKPIDREAILRAAHETKAIVTMEEHSVIGGLGSAVAEVVAEEGIATPVKRLGLQDTFCLTIGSYEDLKQLYALTAEAVAKQVICE